MEPSPNERWAIINISGEVSSGGEPKKCFSGTQPPCLYDQVFYWAYILPLMNNSKPKKIKTTGFYPHTSYQY
jgi:hypothetical protein